MFGSECFGARSDPIICTSDTRLGRAPSLSPPPLTLPTNPLSSLQALKGLHSRLREIQGYLDLVVAGKLPLNHDIMTYLQDIVNLLPNMSVEELSRSLAGGWGARQGCGRVGCKWRRGAGWRRGQGWGWRGSGFGGEWVTRESGRVRKGGLVRPEASGVCALEGGEWGGNTCTALQTGTAAQAKP